MSKKLANAERVADEAIANLAATLPALRHLAHGCPKGREAIDCLCRQIEADVARLRQELEGA